MPFSTFTRDVRSIASTFAIALFVGGCASHKPSIALPEYTRYSNTPRQNLPSDYSAFLRKTKFTHGELDHLPPYAVILYADPAVELLKLGISKNEYTVINLGASVPEFLYVVHPARGISFMVEWGLPGGGGITVESAELAALGARYVVHIGTCGLLGHGIPDGNIVVSNGAYSDGAAVMLSDSATIKHGRILAPGAGLTGAITAVLQNRGAPFSMATGYSIPIYYFQPSGLVSALLSSREFSNPRAGYVEMEESSFFATASSMHFQAASLTVASDRYDESNGRLTHIFINGDRVKTALNNAFAAARDTFEQLEAARVSGQEIRSK